MLEIFYQLCNALHKQTYSQSYLLKKMLTLVKTKAKNTKTTFDASGLLWIYKYFFRLFGRLRFLSKILTATSKTLGKKIY